MKAILSVMALCAVVGLAGCSSSNKTVSPGAMNDSKSGCCGGDKSAGCCKDKASADKTNMGAVSDKPACSKTCPMSGKTTSDAVSPGAVNDSPASSGGCTGHKTGG